MVPFKSDKISINGAVVSSIGGRMENQDDFCFADTPLGFLLVICDGMGGGPGGNTASHIVKCEIAAAIAGCNSSTPREHAFKMAVSKAHDMMVSHMESNHALAGMGSTFVAILINGTSAVIAHAGDSRCYQLRGKKCVYRSNDHSLVAELVRNKALTEEEARISPQSNIITRGLGSVSNNVPEIDEVPFRKGDRFVLCTDGVWGIMPSSQLITRFVQPSSPTKIVESLDAEIDRIGIQRGGGHDNHTLAVMDVMCDSSLPVKKLFIHLDCNWKKAGIIGVAAVAALAAIIAIIVLIHRLHPKPIAESEKNNTTSFPGYLTKNDSESSAADSSLIILDSIFSSSIATDSLHNCVKSETVSDTTTIANLPVQENQVSPLSQKIDSLIITLEDLHDFSSEESKKEIVATKLRNSLAKAMLSKHKSLKESYATLNVRQPVVMESIDKNLSKISNIKYTLSKDGKQYELTPKLKEMIQGYIKNLTAEKEKQSKNQKDNKEKQ